MLSEKPSGNSCHFFDMFSRDEVVEGLKELAEMALRALKPVKPVTKVNLSKVDMRKVALGVFVVALVIGLMNQTSMYQQLNSLPMDRSEMDPIRGTEIKMGQANVVCVRVEIAPILQVTRDVLASALKLRLSVNGMSVVPDAIVAQTKRITMNEIYFEVISPFEGDFTAQLYYYDTPLGAPLKMNTRIKKFYKGHTMAQCVDNYCELKETCWVNSSLRTMFNYPAIIDPSFATDFMNQTIPVSQLTGTHMKPFLRKMGCSYINKNVVILRAPNAMGSLARGFLSFHDDVSKLCTSQNPSIVYVYDPKRIFQRIPLMTDWFKQLSLLHNDTVVCMERVRVFVGQPDGIPLRSYLSEDGQPSDTIVHLKSRISISNLDEVINALHSHCPLCKIVTADVLSEPHDSIRKKIASARIVFGIHTNFFVNMLATSPHATIFDILPRGMNCSTWLFDLAKETNVNLLTIEGQTPNGQISCDNHYDCDNSCKGVSEVTVDPNQILMLDNNIPEP